MQYIFILMLLSLFACKKTPMDDAIIPDEVKILVNSDKASKAVISDEFNANTQLGIFSQVSDPQNNNTLSNPQDINVTYVQDLSSNYWKPVDEAKTIMFKPYNSIDLFAYTPIDNNQNIKLTQDGDRMAIIDAVTLQNTTQDLKDNDFLYAKDTGISNDKQIASLAFKHLFAKLTFNISVSSKWLTNPMLMSAGVTGPSLYDKAIVKLFDGSVQFSKVAAGDVTVKWQPESANYIQLYNNTKAIVELIVMPSNAEGAKLIMQAGGVDYSFTLPKDTKFAVGKNLIFNIILDITSSSDMVIIPTIEDWEVSQTHIIEPS